MSFEDITRDGRDVDLAHAALLIAADEYPDLDVDAWLRHLDHLGEKAAKRVTRGQGDFGHLEQLILFLYRDLGLSGNSGDYYDPRNSYLNDVLERRLGIPITLAVIAMEIGARAGVPLLGVGFPGHFLLRHAVHPELFLDPFAGGRIMTVSECAELLARHQDGQTQFRREFLRPVEPLEILRRMLANLRAIYLQRKSYAKAIRTIDRLILLERNPLSHRRDRGLLLVHCGDPRGIDDLDAYLDEKPEASDRKEVEKLLAEARKKLGPTH